MPQEHEIQINLPGLLRMLGENIYAEADVAVREMIQNAHDTCIIRSTRDKSFKNSRIDITFERTQQILTIADNGAGMTAEELKKNLSTIGESFTRLQKEELRGKDAREALLIGQFGIGLLSAFSISGRVEVITRSYQGDSAFRWVCDGDIKYSVEPCDKTEPGTRVALHLLDSKLELRDETRLRQAIKKYADFLSVPIFLNGKQANACTPPWESKDIDLAEYIQARWDLIPLGIIPFDSVRMQVRMQAAMPRVSGLLFIPMIPYELTRNFGEIDVYISRMFIKANDKELLPRWASFIKGVINTPDLTPTLSRGEIITDEAYQRARTLLGHIIIGYLDMLQEQNPDKLTLLVGAYNSTIKASAMEDDEFFDRICDLVRVNTDRGQITLRDYLEKSGKVIYYFAEHGSGTQHKVLFAHKGLPVIDASWGVEEEFLEKYAERKGVKIERLAADSGAIFTVPETVDDKWQALERDFYQRVRKEAKAVEFEPETVPAVLVTRPLDQNDKQRAGIDAIGAQMGISTGSIKQMFDNLSKAKTQRAAGEDTILHLNTKNQLMRQLRDMSRNETFGLALTCIYNNAVMFAQGFVSPESANLIFEANNAAFSAMITNAQALSKEQEERAKVEMERDKLKRQLQTLDIQEKEERAKVELERDKLKQQLQALDIQAKEERAEVELERDKLKRQLQALDIQAKEEQAKVELERDKLKQQLQAQEIQLTEKRSCFFAFDYKTEDNFHLMEWLQDYFNRKNMGIRIMAPAKEMDHLNILQDLHRQLKSAHFGIADISNNNLNVLYEAGLMHGMGKPLILLHRDDSTVTPPFDIFSDYRLNYGVAKRGNKIQFIWLEEEMDKAMNTVMRMLPEFKNVPKWDGK
ncbi:MAG: hypothetical protein GY862_08065 [Gammaproteobacteria bacterium]|nr:hypothetical protein [Gammaproteobacteria bacterium]